MKTSPFRQLLSRVGLLVAIAIVVAGTSTRADVVYSDITNFSGFAYASGGATNSGGTFYTGMAADDLNLTAGSAGQSVNSFTFSVSNLNSTTVSAQPLVRFFSNDGVGGGPGTLLAGLNFNAIAFAAGTVATFTYSPGAAIFTVPASGVIWAGIFFGNGAGGATAAQLNNLGQGIFAPPTVGSSADAFFQTTTGAPFNSSNPTGTFQFFGGNPQADFGWQISTSNPVAAPDAGSTALLLLVGLAGLVTVQRRFQGSLS